MPSSKKKKLIPVGETTAIRPSKSSRGGGSLNSGTAVVSGNARSLARAVQSLVPNSSKNSQDGDGAQEVSRINGSLSYFQANLKEACAT